MHWLSQRIESLPLHIRFLIPPALGMACAILIVLAFALESERQNALLQHLAREDLPTLESLASAAATLAHNHMELFALLHDAREQLDEEQLYERAKVQIEVMRHLSEQFEQTLDQLSFKEDEHLAVTALHQSLLEGTRTYVAQATSAIELSTLNLDLASRELVAVNTSFIRINEQFLEFQTQARGTLGAEIRQSAEQNRKRVLWLSIAALLLGIAALVFTLRLTRQLTRTLDGHIHDLTQLGRAAEGDLVRPDGKGVLEAMASAIGTFRTTLDKLKHSEAALRQSHDELELQVQQRTRELRETQSELVATARQAGMAEIATNVLHNVGNVLNSVNISADLVSRRVRASKSQGLAKAVQLINQHAADLGEFISHDAKGKLLPGYLNQLVEALASEQQGIIEELEHLTRSVDHIKEIVATQQSYAGASSMLEAVRVTDLLEDALRMNAGALQRHRVRVIKAFSEVPPLLLDKHRLLLILINLISNAKQALSARDNPAHELTLSVRLLDEGNLRICVQDNGEGIAAENLTRIFAHGFTTRKDGHGFGLHSCALAAMEMEGSLTAHSDGPGHGAVFVLELPAHAVAGRS
ncbi:ATP-binding protein [Pseudomonas sp.]|uniref:ATP-binding protein n=1 Tax=Pseudomonas sp. TaxID=306 RepID=UPI00299E9D66|nr:ATP-binding protein [Pseudomonas sp.]MDX1366231.1 ATP-binding protein [Pseudomonas sp.]